MFDPLPPDLALLAGSSQIHYRAELDSTNDHALELAAAGAPAGTAVIADVQRAGRGRRGRTWFSPPGAGLYLSVVVRPRVATSVSLLTLAAGVAAARAIATITGLPIELKWPNDLVIGRPWRKMGGILSESSGVRPTIDAVVIGLGVNLRTAAYPRELAGRVTSIEAELGRPIERGPVVAACLAALAAEVARLDGGDAAGVLDAWRAFGRVALDRASVRWTDETGEHVGVTRGLDLDGALVVDQDGRGRDATSPTRIIAGEVEWTGLGRD